MLVSRRINMSKTKRGSAKFHGIRSGRIFNQKNPPNYQRVFRWVWIETSSSASFPPSNYYLSDEKSSIISPKLSASERTLGRKSLVTVGTWVLRRMWLKSTKRQWCFWVRWICGLSHVPPVLNCKRSSNQIYRNYRVRLCASGRPTSRTFQTNHPQRIAVNTVNWYLSLANLQTASVSSISNRLDLPNIYRRSQSSFQRRTEIRDFGWIHSMLITRSNTRQNKESSVCQLYWWTTFAFLTQQISAARKQSGVCHWWIITSHQSDIHSTDYARLLPEIISAPLYLLGLIADSKKQPDQQRLYLFKKRKVWRSAEFLNPARCLYRTRN